MKQLAILATLGAVLFAAVVEYTSRKKKTTKGNNDYTRGRPLAN